MQLLLRTITVVLCFTPVRSFVSPAGLRPVYRKRLPREYETRHSFPEENRHRSRRGNTRSNAAGVATLPQQAPKRKLGVHVKISGRTLTPYGVYFGLMAWTTGFLLLPALLVGALVSRIVDRRRLRLPTQIGNMWCRLVVKAMGARLHIEGSENLPPATEAAVYVANHVSFLDIPVVTAAIPRACKFLTKAELVWMPLIGWKALLANDLLVYRSSPTTFLALIERAVGELKGGNSIIAFAEGTRSKTGVLRPFKKGPFLMAQKGGARVVPISMTGVVESMPHDSIAPVRRPTDLRVVIHPPIETKGRDTKEVMTECREVISSGILEWQRPPKT